MRHSSSYDLPSHAPSQGVRVVEMLTRQIGAFAGIGLMVLVGAACAALATWNVADPSFSYANDHSVTNLLGFPGAVYADLSMQFLGLASLTALLPPFFWAVLLMAQKNITHSVRRLFFWLISIVAFSGLIALVSPFAQWPMPIGLGGVIGDKVLDFAAIFLTSLPPVLFKPLMALVLAPLSFWSVAVAGGVLKSRVKPQKKQRHQKTPIIDEDFEEEGEERPSFLITMSGSMMHMALRLRSFFRRHRQHPQTEKKAKSFESLERGEKGVRIEPGFASLSAVTDLPDLAYEDEVETFAPRRRRASSAARGQGFELPLLDYLAPAKIIENDPELSEDILSQNAAQLESVLEDFGVKGEVLHVRPGPVVTLYEFEPAPGIKSSRIIGLADDIARSMSALSARVAVIAGRNAIGIELPNPTRHTVYLREIMETVDFSQSKAKLALALGKTIGGEAVIADLAKMPHLLVAGTTGSGKSVAINTMILSLLYRMTPEECRLIMVDPKMLELSVYDGIPHLLTPVVTDPKKAVVALKWAVREMEERYRKMAKLGVRNIDGYNSRIKDAMQKGESLNRTVQTGFDHETGQPVFETEQLDAAPLPYIVVIIDEMADLMMVAGKDIEGAVQRLAQMARAAGIHVIMATQRPSVDVITGTIKANFPTRISFSVTSKIDSRTILGEQGAEQLLGQGDMLFMMGGGRIQRVHGPFVGDDEVEDIVSHLKAQGTPDYLESITQEEDDDITETDNDKADIPEDPYDQAVAVVLRDRKVSTSYIQRRLGIGYNRAASIIERMEDEGLISPANHAGKRDILVPENDADF